VAAKFYGLALKQNFGVVSTGATLFWLAEVTVGGTRQIEQNLLDAITKHFTKDLSDQPRDRKCRVAINSIPLRYGLGSVCYASLTGRARSNWPDHEGDC
jgi:hypothetical protein